MSTKKGTGSNFLNWCFQQAWNVVFVLTVPENTTPKEMGRSFRQWIREVEEKDATLSIHWIWLIPLECKESQRESYVLVGGLSSGEWWFWTKRWKAINWRDAHAGILYSSRRKGMRLDLALRELLDAKFDVQIQFGPRHIQRRRTLVVDEDGLPLDKKLRPSIQEKSKGN